ncbi:hypothetical protein BDY19DRAFT_983745 [Irpex rosettiformis]|uniref:Uncharacterized protein n=1 Tax=Irpex rosettiformis TaxID=378272 RepID=A0ACB8UDG0_9APHY|nr:hypothetical protein BDY19DRAFT_983745 [Irpex rosettiformis]
MATESFQSYLVTGGSGLLGQHIVKLLRSRYPYAPVAVFDLVPSDQDEGVRSFVGDITDRNALEKAVKECKATCIFHTVALLQGPLRDIQMNVNYGGTVNVLSVARVQSVPKLVFTSSASVVSDGKAQVGIDESLPYPPKPFDVYNETKALAEQDVLHANGHGGLSTVSLRVAGLFGPGDKLTVPGFMSMLVAKKTHIQFGDNTNLFDWTYIENAAHAHLLAAERLNPDHPKFSEVAGQAFFITNGEPIPYWDFGRELWKAVGHVPSKITVIPRSVGILIATIMELVSWFTGRPAVLTRFRIMIFCTTRWCSIEKARKALDYEPPVPLHEGIRKAAECWQTHQAPPNN